MKALKAALLGVVFLLGAAPDATPNPDEAAIASFLAIGLANASDEFVKLQGSRDSANPRPDMFVPTEIPTGTGFKDCHVMDTRDRTNPGNQADDPGRSFWCASTKRAADTALFDRIEHIVRDHLPAGYKMLQASHGPIVWLDVWRSPGQPRILLAADAEFGIAQIRAGTLPTVGPTAFSLYLTCESKFPCKK